MSQYNAWHKLHSNDDDVATPWHNFVLNEINETDIEEKMVLEIGCGRGGFAKYLVEKFTSIKLLYACDYSDLAVEMGKVKVENSKITWQTEDIQSLSFDNESFDTIISCETIEHVPLPLKALSELHRVLKPGGRLFLTCPNYFNLFGLWCVYRKIIGKPYTEGGQPYVNYILAPLIYGKLKMLGFTVNHFHSTEFVLPARRPKTFYQSGTPWWLTIFGGRTFYVLIK